MRWFVIRTVRHGFGGRTTGCGSPCGLPAAGVPKLGRVRRRGRFDRHHGCIGPYVALTSGVPLALLRRKTGAAPAEAAEGFATGDGLPSMFCRVAVASPS